MTQTEQYSELKQDRPPTPRAAIREFCMACLCIASGRQAYDCLCVSPPCALYLASPFRGKPMPSGIAPKATGAAAECIAAEQVELENIATRIPRRRPSGLFIRRRCRDCHPEAGDCGMSDCPLYQRNPRSKGGRPKRAMSDKQREAASANLIAARNARFVPKNCAQKASTAEVGLSATIGSGLPGDQCIPASSRAPAPLVAAARETS